MSKPIEAWVLKPPHGGPLDMHSMYMSEWQCRANAYTWLWCSGRFGNHTLPLMQKWKVTTRRWRWTKKRKDDALAYAEELGWRVVKIHITEASVEPAFGI